MALVAFRVASLALWAVGIDVVGEHHSVTPMSVWLCSFLTNKEHHIHIFYIFQCLSIPPVLTATFVISLTTIYVPFNKTTPNTDNSPLKHW